MSDWTPSTEDVRAAYTRLMHGWTTLEWVTEQHARAEFDRWLAQTIREAKAEAWDEGHRTPQDRELDDCRCEAWHEGECACGLFGTGEIITPNPYRQEQGDQDADLNPSNSMGIEHEETGQ